MRTLLQWTVIAALYRKDISIDCTLRFYSDTINFD